MTVPVTTFKLTLGQNFKLWCFYFTAVSGDSNSLSYGLCERQDDNSYRFEKVNKNECRKTYKNR